MEKINVDSSLENSDWVKSMALDIPTQNNIFDIMNFLNIEYFGENADSNIVKFAKSHPWVYSINDEAREIIRLSEKRLRRKNENI